MIPQLAATKFWAQVLCSLTLTQRCCNSNDSICAPLPHSVVSVLPASFVLQYACVCVQRVPPSSLAASATTTGACGEWNWRYWQGQHGTSGFNLQAAPDIPATLTAAVDSDCGKQKRERAESTSY